MPRWTVLGTVFVALCAAFCIEGKKTRSGSGVRLVGGRGPRGRLEISSTAPWMLADGEEVAWRPVCSVGGLVDSSVATIMCRLMGYQYGRRYYSPEVEYRPPNASLSELHNPVGYMYCSLKVPKRALASSGGQSKGGGGGVPSAEGNSAAMTELSSSVADVGSRSGVAGRIRHRRHARSLLAPLYGTIDTPVDSIFTCQFRLGDCDYTGPLVGIECSNRRMPPAPPPPPSPPDMPSAPPPASRSIRLFGPNGGALEPNLCPSQHYNCTSFNRVELQVPAPDGSGGLIWAPLCATPWNFTYDVADLTCWQVYDWPRFAHPDARPDFTVISKPSPAGFVIPKGPSAGASPPTGLFDPAKVAGWASVTGMDKFPTAQRIQDLGLRVSTTPCESGALFAVTCTRRSAH